MTCDFREAERSPVRLAMIARRSPDKFTFHKHRGGEGVVFQVVRHAAQRSFPAHRGANLLGRGEFSIEAGATHAFAQRELTEDHNRSDA